MIIFWNRMLEWHLSDRFSQRHRTDYYRYSNTVVFRQLTAICYSVSGISALQNHDSQTDRHQIGSTDTGEAFQSPNSRPTIPNLTPNNEKPSNLMKLSLKSHAELNAIVCLDWSIGPFRLLFLYRRVVINSITSHLIQPGTSVFTNRENHPKFAKPLSNSRQNRFESQTRFVGWGALGLSILSLRSKIDPISAFCGGNGQPCV